jgi:hypothetical protein
MPKISIGKKAAEISSLLREPPFLLQKRLEATSLLAMKGKAEVDDFAVSASFFKTFAYLHHRRIGPPVRATRITFQGISVSVGYSFPYATTVTVHPLSVNSFAKYAVYVAGPPISGG